MAKIPKLYKIQELAEQTATEISGSPAAWTGYLDTAARLYRYPFSDSLLIHAQRPDTMACASMGVWNKKMGRWIRKGAKGIALIDDMGPERRLWYVFDMADTRLLPGSRVPFLWQIPERHRETILELLVDTYQLDQGTGQLHAALFEIASSLTKAGLETAMKGLDTQMEGSPLRGRDESIVRDTFQILFRNSVFYVLARRCGLEPMDYLKPEDFAGITDFNTLTVLSYIGENTSRIAEPVLRDIGRKVRRIYQQETQKTLANGSDLVYNEFNTLKYKSNRKKGETIYGTDLSSQRGLSVPEPDNRGTERDHRKIRDAAENFHEGEQEGLVSGAAPERETGQLLSGDRQDGAGADGSDYGEPAGEVPGTGQGDRPDGLGVPYERPDGHGGGDGLNGTGLQLENTTENDMTEAEEEIASALSLPELLSAEEQVYGIEKQSRNPYAGGSLIPDEAVDEILRTGGNRANSRYRIIYNFMSEQSPEEYAGFIRQEYGTGGKGLEIGGDRYSVWFDKPGMQVAIGETVEAEKAGLGKRFLSWEEVSNRIHRLLKAGEYAPQEILDGARRNALKEHAEVLLYMWQDMADKTGGGIFSNDEIIPGGFPDRKAHMAGLLSQPEYVEKLMGKLERLSESYGENRDIMRFHIHRPDQVLERFRKFAKEVSPYQARDGFTGKELPAFITQDEADAYFYSHSPSVNGRLEIYEFYQKNKTNSGRADFLKKIYGTGGCSHALLGADGSFADYAGSGIRLTRGDVERPEAEIFLKWPEAAEKIGSLIEQERYLQPGDFARMELYERGKMANRVMQFYWGMPSQVARPWDGNPDHSGSSWYKDVIILLSHPDRRAELARHMEQALAELPLDFKDYGERARILSELQGYVDGTFTLFPEQKRPHIEGEEDRKEKKQGRETGQMSPLKEESNGGGSEGKGRIQDREKSRETEQSQKVEQSQEAEQSQRAERGQETGQSQKEEQGQKAKQAQKTGQEKEQNPENQKGSAEKAGSQEQKARSVSAETTITHQADSRSQAPYPEENRQMSLFDFMDNDAIGEPSEASNRRGAGTDGQTGDGRKQREETFAEGGPEGKNPEEKNQRGSGRESLPEIQERVNFRITDDSLGSGGPKQKFRANLDAIRLLKTLESQGRLAVPDEQETLSKFVGWGGLAEAFDEKNKNWEKEYIRLKETLTPEEYKEARATTLNAFYTPPVVIRVMYEALGNMGLKSGNLLEPSCGIGNFMGLVPEEMSGLKMYGVELDGISGRIARQLYQKNPIAIQGFESTDYPDSFFDCVIGNVPFGSYKVSDRRYDRHNFLIHDYFIAKSLDLVRPGGVVAVVTSSGTMDKQNSGVRRYLASRADLLGAVRLPNNAFLDNAGTKTVTDILFFQKRDQASLEQPEWVSLGVTPEGHSVNAYFVSHPEMVLGEYALESGQYGRQELTVTPIKGAVLSEQLKTIIGRIQGKIEEPELEENGLEEPTGSGSIPADPSVKNYSFTDIDGEVFYWENSRMNRVKLPAMTRERVLGMVHLRDTARRLIECQTEDGSEGEIRNLQRELNEKYDRFTKRYGLLNSTANRRAFSQDSSYCLLSSLELVDEDGKLKQKADIFTKRTIRKAEPVDFVETASEALAVSIGEKAGVDLAFMAALARKTEGEITEELAGGL